MALSLFVIINFIIKRRMRMERRIDKENSFNGEQGGRVKTPITSKAPLTPSNHSLRKKIDENLQHLKSNDKEFENSDQKDFEFDSRRGTEGGKGKRENAKNRGFDMKVNSIANINDKINSLLNMVKKEKSDKNERSDKLEKERAINRSREVDSPNIQIRSKYRRETAPFVSLFMKDIIENKQEQNQGHNDHLNKNSLSLKPHIDDKSNHLQAMVKPNRSEEPSKDMNLKQLRRKYLPEEASTHSQTKKLGINWREKSFATEIDQEAKVSNHFQSLISQKEVQSHFLASKKNIDQMIEERKRKRQQQRLQQRKKFEKTTMQDSAFSENQVPQRSQNISSFALANPIIQNPRNDKINATTRLIDEQIKRIKTKIDQSESNNQKIQIKLLDKHQNSTHMRSMNSIIEKQHTTRIAQKLSSQIEYDNLLRQARVTFEKNANEEKWTIFQKQLEKNGMKMSLQYIKELMRVSPDEHNPFPEEGKHPNCSDLVTLFMDAQNNWENYVCGCTSLKQLKDEDYSTTELDLNQKGNLSIEDIVCFINLYTGRFYRNRDLSLIFRRFQLSAGQTGNNLTYKAFEKTLTE